MAGGQDLESRLGPEFTAKMNRVLDLYDHRPADGRVICVDEFGPLNLQPRAGRGWFPRRHPRRLRATYRRTQGVRHLLWTWPPANSTTGSGIASGGRSSCRCSSRCARGGPVNGST